MISWANLRGVDDGWVRPRPGPSGLRTDIRYAAGLLVLGVAMVSMAHAAGSHPYGRNAALGWQVLLIALAAAPLAARRMAPELVAIWEAIALVVLQVVGISDGFCINVYTFVAFFAVGAWGRNRARADAVRLLIVLAMAIWLVTGMIMVFAGAGDTLPDAPGLGPLPPVAAAAIYAVISNAVYFASAYFFGNAAWVSARREALLHEQTEQLRAERERNAAAAVMRERVRIARELHDVVAHSVSLMGVQAAAARRSLHRDPAQASASLSSVEDTARDTVAELGGLLGMLRSGDGANERDRAPSPDVSELPGLVEDARRRGLAADVTVVGEPSALPESVSVSLYRIAQEALTNTVKHARASRVDVRLRYLADEVELEVVDDGITAHTAGGGDASGAPGSNGSGLGQLGIRERVALHEGSCEIGARTGQRGYRVRVRLPLQRDREPVAR